MFRKGMKVFALMSLLILTAGCFSSESEENGGTKQPVKPPTTGGECDSICFQTLSTSSQDITRDVMMSDAFEERVGVYLAGPGWGSETEGRYLEFSVFIEPEEQHIANRISVSVKMPCVEGETGIYDLTNDNTSAAFRILDLRSRTEYDMLRVEYDEVALDGYLEITNNTVKCETVISDSGVNNVGVVEGYLKVQFGAKPVEEDFHCDKSWNTCNGISYDDFEELLVTVDAKINHEVDAVSNIIVD